MSAGSLFETAARRDRLLVGAALALASLLGLWATLRSGGALMGTAAPPPGSGTWLALTFVMWWAMMLAMMLPSAAPAILTYAAMSRKFATKGVRRTPVAIFVAGYAAIWTLFGLSAVVLQIAAARGIGLTGMLAVTGAVAGGALLVAAGLYQLSPLKQACLRQCQTPLMFFARNWLNGSAGAFRMGLRHGIYCLGCCWVLMGLLFYGGVMAPAWIIGLAAYVAAEKLALPWLRLNHWSGGILILWGAATIAAAVA